MPGRSGSAALHANRPLALARPPGLLHPGLQGAPVCKPDGDRTRVKELGRQGAPAFPRAPYRDPRLCSGGLPSPLGPLRAGPAQVSRRSSVQSTSGTAASEPLPGTPRPETRLGDSGLDSQGSDPQFPTPLRFLKQKKKGKKSL